MTVACLNVIIEMRMRKQRPLRSEKSATSVTKMLLGVLSSVLLNLFIATLVSSREWSRE